MRKVQLTAYDFGMFDCDISPTEYDFFIKHKGAFKRMWSDQGQKFWNRFVVCFRAFSQNYGAIKEFPVKSDKYEAYIDQAFTYIHDQFVEGKVSTAKGLVLDTVVVAQNRQSLQYLESQSFAKDPFYNKDTRDVFRRLFGQPGEKSSYVKVYFLIPLYVKFGGSVCRCLRHWLDADEIDSADESYYIPPGPNMILPKSEKRKELLPASSKETRARSLDRDLRESSKIKAIPDSDAQKTTVDESSTSDQATGGTKKKKRKKKKKEHDEGKRSESSDSTSSGANESKAAKSESAPNPMLGAVIAPNTDKDPTLDAIIAAVLKNNVEVEKMQKEASAAKRAAAAAKESEAGSSAESASSTVGQKSSNPSSPVRPKTNKKDTFVANEDSPLVQKLEETFGLPKPAQTKKGQRDKSPPIKISVSGCEEGKKKLAEAEKRGERTSATVNVTVTFDREVRDQITPEKTKAAFQEVLHNMYTKPPKERLSHDPRERKEQIRERLRRKHACKDMPQVLDCHWASDLRRAESEKLKERQQEEMFDISKEDMAKKLSELCKFQPDKNNPWAAQGPPVPPPAHILKMVDESDVEAKQSTSTQTTEVQSAKTQITPPSSPKTSLVPLKSDSSVQEAASDALTTHSTEASPSPKSEGTGKEGEESSIIVILDEDRIRQMGELDTAAGEERRGASLVELKPNGEEEVLESMDEDDKMLERRAKAVAEQIALLAGIPPQGNSSIDDDSLQNIDISKYVQTSTVENPIMFDGQLLSPGDRIINVYHPPGTPGIPLASEAAKRIKVLGKPLPDLEAEKREAERKEAERKEAERKEAERKEAERKEAEKKEQIRKKISELEAASKKAGSVLEDSSKKAGSETSSKKKFEDDGIRVTGDDDGIRVRGESPTKKHKEKSTKSSKPTDAKPKGGATEKNPSSGQPSKGLGADAVEKIKSGMFAPILKGKQAVVQDYIEGPGCALIGMYIPQNPDNPDKQDRIGMMRVNETMNKIREMQACQEKWDLTHEEFDEITLNGTLQLNDQLVIDYLSKKNQASRPTALRPPAIEDKKGKKTGKLRSCSNCGQIEPQPRTFKTCQRCKEKHSKYPRFYCGRDCQIEDWGARHKQEHVDMD